MSIKKNTCPLPYYNHSIMQRDHYKTLDDFLLDPSFQEWVREGIDNDGWQTWMQQEPANVRLAREAYSIIAAMIISPMKISDDETETALSETWEKIHNINQPTIKVSWLHRILKPVAAAITLLSGAGLIWLLANQATAPVLTKVDNKEIKIIERNNNSSEPMLVTLEDGSSLLLQPGSQISYPAQFDLKERKVMLSGEAFFEISKNPDHPFLVFANETVTRVIGTSFRIRAYNDQPEVEIMVRTGQVKVSAAHQEADGTVKEIALNPNESVLYVRDEAVFAKPAVASHTSELPIEQLYFEFKDAPVSEIFETIQKAYGMQVHYPLEVLKDCYLSTSLTDEPLPQKLKIIVESLGGQTYFQINDDQITIYSNGCN